MICPYCGKEMRYGVIQSQHEISWKPKKGKFFATAQFSKETIILSEFSFLKGSCVEAYCCDECRKIVIDYGDGNLSD